MNKSRFDSLLTDIVSSLNQLMKRLSDGSTLILAFAVTLVLLIIGLFAVNVVLPVILAALGAMFLINMWKYSPRATGLAIDKKEAQNDFEAVYLQTVCAELIQAMERAGGAWAFGKIEKHLAREEADARSVIQACEELEWLKTDYEAGLATATGKGISESRKFLDWAKINSA